MVSIDPFDNIDNIPPIRETDRSSSLVQIPRETDEGIIYSDEPGALQPKLAVLPAQRSEILPPAPEKIIDLEERVVNIYNENGIVYLRTPSQGGLIFDLKEKTAYFIDREHGDVQDIEIAEEVFPELGSVFKKALAKPIFNGERLCDIVRYLTHVEAAENLREHAKEGEYKELVTAVTKVYGGKTPIWLQESLEPNRGMYANELQNEETADELFYDADKRMFCAVNGSGTVTVYDDSKIFPNKINSGASSKVLETAYNFCTNTLKNPNGYPIKELEFISVVKFNLKSHFDNYAALSPLKNS